MRPILASSLGRSPVELPTAPGIILMQENIPRVVRAWGDAILAGAPATRASGRIFAVQEHFPLLSEEENESELAVSLVWFGAVRGSRVLAWARRERKMLVHPLDLCTFAERHPKLDKELGAEDGAGVVSRASKHPYGEGKCCGVWWPPQKPHPWAEPRTFKVEWYHRTYFLFRNVPNAMQARNGGS
jgi:hypothetical protein